MFDEYDDVPWKSYDNNRRSRLLGLKYSWHSRSVATDDLKEGFQSVVEKQLDSIVHCPILPDDVIRSVGETLEKQPQRSPVSKAESFDIDASLSRALMRSNHRLTPSQMSHARTSLEGKNSELLEMDYDILRLQLKINESVATMNALIKSRLEKQKEADSCQIWLASARLLPLDVIVRILTFAKESGLRDYSSPLKLSRVCSSWRDAALTCSSLWNDLELTLSSFYRGERDDPTIRANNLNSVMALWFGRANPSLPLSLSIHVHSELGSEMGDGVARGILPFSSRVKRLCFQISQTGYDKSSFRGFEAMAPFLKLPAGTFPLLEDLTFVDWTPQKTDEVIPRITVFEDSTRLRRIILHAQPWWMHHEPSLILSWAQITHLKIGGTLTTRCFANVLFQCRQLQKAVFSCVTTPREEDEPPSIPEHPLTFPDLRDFKLGLGGPDLPGRDDIADILSSIVLPAVEKLYVSRGTPLIQLFPYDGFPILALVPLSEGTFPPLRKLMLSYADIELEELLQLLEACPLLEQLSLCLNSIPPQLLLEALKQAGHSRSDAAMPLLSHLSEFAFAAQFEDVQQNEHTNNIVRAFGDLVSSWIVNPVQLRPLSEVLLCMSDLQLGGHCATTPALEAHFEQAILEQIGDKSGIQVVVQVASYKDLHGLFEVVDPVDRENDYSYFV